MSSTFELSPQRRLRGRVRQRGGGSGVVAAGRAERAARRGRDGPRPQDGARRHVQVQAAGEGAQEEGRQGASARQ